jgi:hypothetical protein
MAHQKGADKDVINALEKTPDQEYDSPTDISKEVGRLHQKGRF